MWRRGRGCRATASVCASRARGQRCSAAAPQRHVTCRVSASGLKKRRSVLKVGLFSFPVLFSLSFLLHLSLANEKGQRTTERSKRSHAHPVTRSPVLLGEKTSSYFLFTSPQFSPSPRPLPGFSPGLVIRVLTPRRVYLGIPEVYTIRTTESSRESDKHNYLPFSHCSFFSFVD